MTLRALMFSLGFLCLPAAAWAQKVLVSQSTTVLYDMATGQVEWSLPGGVGLSGAVFTSDGRYALAVSTTSTTPAVRIFDIVRGSSFDVPVPFQPTLAHPRATAVYGLFDGPLSFGVMTRGTAARLDPSGLVTYEGCAPGTTTALDLSGDGRLLFALCESGDLVVLDAESGAVLRTLPVGQGVTFAVNVDGTALVVARPTPGGALELLDATTGAILGSTVVPGNGTCTPSVNQASRDKALVIVSCLVFSLPVPGSFQQVLSMPTLTWGATLDGVDLRIASVSPDNRQAYSVYQHRLGFGATRVHDLATGAATLSVPLVARIAVSYPPLAPTAAVAVSGRRVDLSWTLASGSPAASQYVLEIGSAPGRADLGTVVLDSQLALTVPSVPAGRYFVRVTAGNASGQSAPSDELVVDVS